MHQKFYIYCIKANAKRQSASLHRIFLYKNNSSDYNLQRRSRVFLILWVTRFSSEMFPTSILKAKIRKVRSLSDPLLSCPQEFPPQLLQRPLFQPRRKIPARFRISRSICESPTAGIQFRSAYDSIYVSMPLKVSMSCMAPS